MLAWKREGLENILEIVFNHVKNSQLRLNEYQLVFKDQWESAQLGLRCKMEAWDFFAF